MLNAYAIRKMVPRLVIGVILINLSIYLCVAMIDLTDIIGKGLGDLLRSPFIDAETFKDTKIKGNIANSGTFTVAAGSIGVVLAGILTGTAGGAALGILMTVAVLLLPLVFVALAVLITLAVRYGLVIFLTVISPIAIACMILPSTEKYFRQWWSLFLKTLLVYPIIAILFAMSDIMAAIFLSAASSEDTSGGEGVIALLTAIIAICAPIFMIPFAFKFAGGALASVYDLANKGTARAGTGIYGDKKDPDSFISKLARGGRARRTEAGLTGRQFAAGIVPRRNYRKNLQEAKGLDQFKDTQAAMQSDRFKSKAQDSDVMQSLAWGKGRVDEHKKQIARQLAIGKKLDKEGNFVDTEGIFGERGKTYTKKDAISQQAYERQMQAHSDADAIGRDASTRRAAFQNNDRIKFAPYADAEGHAEELALAREIYGDDASVAEAMNEHQARATAAGRVDLAGSLYGDPYDALRGPSKVSASQILSGNSAGVKGSIRALMGVAADPKAKAADKEAAVRILADLQANAASPYGGNEENKRIVAGFDQEIDATYEHVARTAGPTVDKDGNLVAGTTFHGRDGMQVDDYEYATGRQITTRVPGEANPDSPQVEVTQPERKTVSGHEAAYRRIKELSGRAVDPAVAAKNEAEAAAASKPPEE